MSPKAVVLIIIVILGIDAQLTSYLILEQLDRFILHSKRIQNSNNSPPEIFTVGADLERAVAIVLTSLA